MATKLSLDPKLLDRALAVSGERTKKAAVTRALEEFIARSPVTLLLDTSGLPYLVMLTTDRDFLRVWQ